MKTLTIQVPLSDQEAELLASKFQVKELESMCIRECLMVLGALTNDILKTIPLIQTEDERMEHSL